MKPEYKNAVVYKIVCLDPNIKDLYVGSTTNLTVRKYRHKHSCNNKRNIHHNLYVYRFIRNHGGFDNWQVIPIKQYNNITTKRALLKKERKYIERLNSTLNVQIPLRTPIEYNKDHKEEIQEYKQKWYEENKILISQQRKQDRQSRINDVRERDNAYRDANKERINANQRKGIRQNGKIY